MGSTLFMPGQDMVQLILVSVQKVVHWHYGTSRVAENSINTFLYKRKQNRFRTGDPAGCLFGVLVFAHNDNCINSLVFTV
jgi:hypothetical protein